MLSPHQTNHASSLSTKPTISFPYTTPNQPSNLHSNKPINPNHNPSLIEIPIQNKPIQPISYKELQESTITLNAAALISVLAHRNIY
jgi:hypothetical protein